MNQFLVIMGDSLRLLRARVLFWITLGISAFVALAYLSTGFDEKGITFIFGLFSFESEYLVKGSDGAEILYTLIFSKYLVGIWLTLATLILGLISCGPIFPEFMLEGAAGVTLSKPIPRWALFLYKFIGGLLFVALQTLVFSMIIFIAIRWRIGIWNFSVFYAVPIVVLVFSYLFSVQTLFGVITRSSMVSILVTIMVWFVAWGINGAESLIYHAAYPKGDRTTDSDAAAWRKWYPAVRLTHMITPKISQTSDLLGKKVVMRNGKNSSLGDLLQIGGNNRELGDAVKEAEKPRFSTGYLIWTSLGFEAVMLCIAGWSFSRRDF